MPDTIIMVDSLTKDYGGGRGIFRINLNIKQGEVFGYIGTNGSGKTTTIRSMMGFIKPGKGNSSVSGLNSWKQAPEIMKNVSYIPGEIAFPSLATGTGFLKLQAEYLGVKDYAYMNHIIEMLQLDPLMREAFLDLIREEKAKGHTVFMSSHIFEEIEEVCDRVAMIKDGKIVDVADLYELRHSKEREYHIVFRDADEAARFAGNTNFTKSLKGAICTAFFKAINETKYKIQHGAYHSNNLCHGSYEYRNEFCNEQNRNKQHG